MAGEDVPTNPRAHWPVRVVRLRDDDDGAGRTDTTAEQRLASMWELAVQAWTLAGRTIPDYDRAHTPVSIRRRGEEPE